MALYLTPNCRSSQNHKKWTIYTAPEKKSSRSLSWRGFIYITEGTPAGQKPSDNSFMRNVFDLFPPSAQLSASSFEIASLKVELVTILKIMAGNEYEMNIGKQVGPYFQLNPTPLTGNLSWNKDGEISWDKTPGLDPFLQRLHLLAGQGNAFGWLYRHNFSLNRLSRG
jgi:hypothetical protein